MTEITLIHKIPVAHYQQPPVLAGLLRILEGIVQFPRIEPPSSDQPRRDYRSRQWECRAGTLRVGTSGGFSTAIHFTLSPGTIANVQVQYGGQNSAKVPIEVVPSFAGIFTQQTNGRGQAVARNQDGSVNSSAEGAQRGSFVSLYANGLGAVTPAATAGAAAPSETLSRVEGITVLVGGVPANVAYAGLAPGLVGTYQINFQVPSNGVPGSRSVVILPSRGYPSQGRTYIFVE